MRRTQRGGQKPPLFVLFGDIQLYPVTVYICHAGQTSLETSVRATSKTDLHAHRHYPPGAAKNPIAGSFARIPTSIAPR